MSVVLIKSVKQNADILPIAESIFDLFQIIRVLGKNHSNGEQFLVQAYNTLMREFLKRYNHVYRDTLFYELVGIKSDECDLFNLTSNLIPRCRNFGIITEATENRTSFFMLTYNIKGVRMTLLPNVTVQQICRTYNQKLTGQNIISSRW